MSTKRKPAKPAPAADEPDTRLLDALGMWGAATGMVLDITEDHVVETLPSSRMMVEVEGHYRNQIPGEAFVMGVVHEPGDGVQVARMRFAMPDGRMPVIYAPTTSPEAFEFFMLGLHTVAALRVPVFVSLEPELAEFGDLRPPKNLPSAESLKPARRFDTKLVGDDLAGARYCDSLVRDNAEALSRSSLDKQPKGEAKVDWLVISYGVAAHAAQRAVDEARQKGLGVDHLVLKTLSPLPERVIASAAMGKRFVVVAERNFGQLHSEIQRVCPSFPVVLVSSPVATVKSEQVLGALLKFPRCC